MKKFFRWIWNINSIILLLILTIAFVKILSDFIEKKLHKSEPEEYGIPLISRNEKAAEKLKYDIDNRIKQIKDILIFKLKSNMFINKGNNNVSNIIIDPNNESFGIFYCINFLFISTITGERRFLFDQNVLISDAIYAEFEKSERHTFSKNIYEVISQDSNGNNRLDEDDQKALYVSDYDGRNLKMIQTNIKDFEINANQQLLVISEKKGQKLFHLYNAEKDQMQLILNSSKLELEQNMKTKL